MRDGQAQILARIGAPLAPELVPLTRAVGRVLTDDFAAPFDVPPADNSAVDGYAVGGADIPAGGTRDLVVIGDLAAGFVFEGKLGAGQALRIMTGAPMPAGADTVYPQEVVQRQGDHITAGPIDKGANVRLAGEDVEMGAVVIEAGTVLRPQEIGLVASLGAWQVTVSRRPRVALLSTGDEVAEPGSPRRPGQIYDANRFTLRGSIEQCGGEVIDLAGLAEVCGEGPCAQLGGEPAQHVAAPPSEHDLRPALAKRTCHHLADPARRPCEQYGGAGDLHKL